MLPCAVLKTQVSLCFLPCPFGYVSVVACSHLVAVCMSLGCSLYVTGFILGAESFCSPHLAVLIISIFAAAKLVIIANNCPAVRKSEIEYYVMLSKAGVYKYTGSALLPYRSGGLVCVLVTIVSCMGGSLKV
jgi:ribosomal protein L30E